MCVCACVWSCVAWVLVPTAATVAISRGAVICSEVATSALCIGCLLRELNADLLDENFVTGGSSCSSRGEVVVQHTLSREPLGQPCISLNGAAEACCRPV